MKRLNIGHKDRLGGVEVDIGERDADAWCEQMMSCLVNMLGLPLVATLIALFDDHGPCQDRRWQYS